MNRYQGHTLLLRLFFWMVVFSGIGYGGYFLYKREALLKHQLDTLSKEVADERSAVRIAPTIIKGNGSVTTWIDVQRQVKNTVVKIITDIAAFNWLEPYTPPAVGKGSGSGFFINSDGDIVTNWHVVNQGQLVQIEIPALGAERLKVRVAGICPERDVALLRLTPYSKQRIKEVIGDIPFLKFGNSDEIRRGQDVLALGYPLGVQGLKSTQGIVSGRERVGMIKQSCIQTTAPLNPGNSGGPSITSSGEVIGINFAGVVKAQNVGYIIPINDLKSAIKDLHKIRLLRRPLLGCSLEPANADMIEFLGNPMPGGFYIPKTYKNMMLEKVGVLAGDMIYEVNGYTIDRFGRATVPWNEDKVSMLEILDRLEVGDKVYMLLYRKGVKKEIEFMLEPRFLQPVRYMYPDFEKVDYETIAGIVVMDLTQNHIPLLAENSHALLAYEAPEKQYEPALVVSAVQPTSLANKLRLLYPGMIITEINGEKVKTLEEFRVAVRKSKKTRFLTIRTQAHWFVVFAVDNIVADEDRLASIYQFKKSGLIDEIA